MSVSLYDMTLPVLARGLRNTIAIVDKAQAWADAKQAATPPSLSVEQGLVQARLTPDMFAFARQVQIAADMAKGCAARLSAVDVPSWPDDEATLAELKSRLEKTLAFVEAADRATVDAATGRTITLKSGGRELSFGAVDYVNRYVFPNFYFHLTMVYALLRQAGVPIGKGDFLGA
jgi:hypothetical protein